ncbi:HAD-IC family P-type ATPase [Pseudoflavonifractor phocaeensis]|uniref:cation-translocating P-type ATPase n=1 Tax=Pseudoflavonifractor phocaeensis TaxID=1870988 RepID=UPI00313AAFBF
MKERKAPQSKIPVQRAAIPVEDPAPESGLSREQVTLRQKGGWSNVAVESPTKTEKEIVKENVFTFFNLIFLVLAVALLAVGSYKDATFIFIAVANTAIGIFQEIRSKRTIDKLKLLAAPRGTVVREGAEMSVPTDHMVRDDIAVFSAGDQITADAVVRSGVVQVNEAMITGEADPLEKGPGGKLRSGSFVVSGSCRAQLTQVGADSYAARLTLEAKKDVNAGRSEMMASLDKLIRVIGVALVPMGAILFWKQYFVLELGLKQAVTATVAALIGMIPEGLYLLTSVALAVSMIRLAQKKTLAQDMNCIETLARVDVLCVDKTGTITEQKMTVREVVPLDEERYPMERVEEAVSALYQALGADNDTGRAMAERFQKKVGWKPSATVPFTSANKYSAAVFPGQGAFVAGAPEFVMGERYEDLKEMVEPYSAKGYRVLLLAEYDGVPDGKGPLDGRRVRPMALALISNRIRPEAPETFAYFAQQGVAVKVISGDNPLTVAEVARKAGVENAEKWVDAATLQTDEAIFKAAEEYTVFGRVTPGQKRKLVKALQKQGHTVAMTGDGVNDVLALKDADCGIAMASGSDAACHAAQLVLLESNFACLPQVVAEGRRVINNIQRSASLFLVKNIFSFCLSLLTILVDMPYPLVPIQLSLVSALTIGFPSFVLALEPNKSRVSGKFMVNVLREAFPGGLTDLIIILGIQAFAFAFHFSTQSLSTLAALCMAFIGLLILFQVCKPFDGKRRALWGGVAAAMVFCVLFLQDFFSLSPLGLQEGLVLAVFLALSYPVMRAILWCFRRLGRLVWSVWNKTGIKKRKKS